MSTPMLTPKTIPKSILLIEDEPALHEAIKLKLEKAGIKVYSFFTAEEAVPFLKKEKPDLVWLDILLPGMNGLEFLKQIREDFSLINLPVIIVSVSHSSEKIKKAFELNVLDFIVKSDNSLDDIIKKVERLLYQKK